MKIFFLASFGLSVAEGKIKKGDAIITQIITGILSQIDILIGENTPDLEAELVSS